MPNGVPLRKAVHLARQLGCVTWQKGGDLYVKPPQGRVIRTHASRKDASIPMLVMLKKLAETKRRST